MQLWEAFLHQLEQKLGKSTVEKWLRTLTVAKFDACNLYLQAKDKFQVNWFEEHVRPIITKSFVNNNRHPVKVHIFTGELSTGNNRKNKKNFSPNKTEPSLTLFRFDELDPLYRLENFIPSQKNLIIYKLLAQVTGNSSGNPELAAFNPIYLYGPTGTGKTHLLMSVSHALKERGYHPIYVRTETFTDHVVNAIRCGDMRHFRDIYRQADVLIIDDVHSFSRKGATQEELFHTFNALHLEGKQIILAANCAPNALQLIEPRLVSRFEWGIVLSLEEATLDERRAILMKKIELMGFPLHPKVIDYLLETFKSSVCSLCQAFQALILKSHLGDSTRHIPSDMLTVSLVKDQLKRLLEQEALSVITPDRLIQVTAEHYGITTEDIQGKSQSRDCVSPRQIAMYLCREELKIPYIQLGDIFNRDHSTVMSAVKNIKKKVTNKDKETEALLSHISKKARTK